MGMGSLINRRCQVMGIDISCRYAGTSSYCHEAHLGVRCVLRHIIPNAHVPSGLLERCQGDDGGWIDPLLEVS